MSKRNNTLKSFSYATNGIKEAFNTEPNFKVHIFIGAAAIILSFFFKFTKIEFALLVITIATVIILELINTVVEKLVDIVSPKISKRAKVIKDLSAGIVLISALASIVIGIILFLPKILQLLTN